MLQLKNIRKSYLGGESQIWALKGVSLSFRKKEFVSILGPSGCGKTTLLNIIGGLDRYTDGDLIIRGRSTKDYGNRDWDTYRNHTIGFVFQSYNLIPHQTVLQNVELALTLSGVSKAERRRRAKEALEKVGLTNQLRKKPSQMSGGQMQRVAIARALVNNPDIILADEPTGALDTETSVQVMDLLKEVAKERLVIMVTHNPDLADRYSTRIIRMLDGVVIGDSAPVTEEELATEQEGAVPKKKKREKKPSMSFATSFGLSLKNLFTKKGRTALTGFAGSIGIIGIALIYAVSQGTSNYIEVVQEDTLSSYPLTLEATHTDIGSLLESFMGKSASDGQHENDAVYQKSMIYDMLNTMNSMETEENDLRSFKAYLEDAMKNEEDTTGLRENVNGVQYTYNLDLQVFTESPEGEIVQSDATALMRELVKESMGMDMSSMTSSSPLSSSFSSSSTSTWQEMLPGKNGEVVSPLLESQYDVIWGNWPTAYNEVVLVVDEKNELNDIALYALGLKNKEDIDAIMDASKNGTTLEVPNCSWSYEEIGAKDYRLVLNSDCYTKNEEDGTYSDLRDTDAGKRYLYDNAVNLKVVGILRPSEEAVSTMFTGSIGYTKLLTEYAVEQMQKADAVAVQTENKETDILTGLPFKAEASALDEAGKQEAFLSAVKGQTTVQKAQTYTDIISLPSQETLDAAVEQTLGSMNRAAMEATMLQSLTAQMNVSEDQLKGYLSSMSDEELTKLFRDAIEERVKTQYATGVAQQLAMMSEAQKAAALDKAVDSYTAEQCAQYYDEVLTFSDSTYEDNLKKLGFVDLDEPATINLYASTFAGKDVIEDAIHEYNDSVDEVKQIVYTDYVGIIMSSVTTIIDAITYVLIAFVSISLIVSSIMIGVITLISVQERTKEIGILRSLGASKRDVSGMFNAETLIIGFLSGAIGVGMTWLLCIPINAIIGYLTDIPNLKAVLPLPTALVLVGISMLLTLVAGIIPSRSAAKKDPVVALRTE